MEKRWAVIFLTALFLCRVFVVGATGPSALLDDIGLSSSSQANTQKMPVPDPGDLNPQWWQFFEVNGSDLTQRIATLNQQLQSQMATLSIEEQQTAAPFFNQLIVNLNSLVAAKKQQSKEVPAPSPFRQSYSLEQQLELNQKIRKLKVEKRNEADELDSIRIRISKVQKRLDDLLVFYLTLDQSSSKKYVTGLEIMAQRSVLSIAEENQRILQNRVELLGIKLDQMQKELQVAKGLLTVAAYNEHQLEREIQSTEAKLEQAQAELSKSESNSLNFLGDTAYDRSLKYLLTQKLVHASINKTLVWTKLAFLKLQYNLIMHLNNRFQESHQDMRKGLEVWKNSLDSLTRQVSDWKKVSLKEQDRVRQDYAFLTKQSDNAETSKLMRLNQSRRQESLDSVSEVQMLEDEIFNTKWLIDRLEDYIQSHSSFIIKWWMGLNSFVVNTWSWVMSWMRYSLFKVGGIPITLLTLFRIAIILTMTFIVSKVVRSALISFGASRGNITESTLYTLGRLGHYFVLGVGGVIAIFSIGLDFSNLVIITGALTFGIGFGLQSLATNFFCGLRILFERKIKIGDYIELESGLYGKITEIHIQNTVICTSDGREVIIPNSELSGHQLINWTMNNDYRRLHIPFQISYNNDKDFVRRIISHAAKRVPCTLIDSKYGDPQVWLVKFGETALEFELVVWVNYKSESYTDSKEADYLWEIETALREHRIELPMPQQLVHIRQLPNVEKDGLSAHQPSFLEVATQEKSHGQIGITPSRSLS